MLFMLHCDIQFSANLFMVGRTPVHTTSSKNKKKLGHCHSLALYGWHNIVVASVFSQSDVGSSLIQLMPTRQ